MIVYGKGWSEKLATCQIFAAYVPAYVPPTLKYETYTRIHDICHSGQLCVKL